MSPLLKPWNNFLNSLKIKGSLDNTGMSYVGPLILRFLSTNTYYSTVWSYWSLGCGLHGGGVRSEVQGSAPQPLSCSRVGCLQCPPLMSFMAVEKKCLNGAKTQLPCAFQKINVLVNSKTFFSQPDFLKILYQPCQLSLILKFNNVSNLNPFWNLCFQVWSFDFLLPWYIIGLLLTRKVSCWSQIRRFVWQIFSF